jgi:hypothetical protein
MFNRYNPLSEAIHRPPVQKLQDSGFHFIAPRL